MLRSPWPFSNAAKLSERTLRVATVSTATNAAESPVTTRRMKNRLRRRLALESCPGVERTTIAASSPDANSGRMLQHVQYLVPRVPQIIDRLLNFGSHHPDNIGGASFTSARHETQHLHLPVTGPVGQYLKYILIFR